MTQFIIMATDHCGDQFIYERTKETSRADAEALCRIYWDSGQHECLTMWVEVSGGTQ